MLVLNSRFWGLRILRSSQLFCNTQIDKETLISDKHLQDLVGQYQWTSIHENNPMIQFTPGLGAVTTVLALKNMRD